MKFEINTKYNIGDTVYFIRLKETLEKCNTCGHTTNTNYSEQEIVETTIVDILLCDAEDEDSPRISVNGLLGWHYEIDIGWVVEEFDLFATREEAQANKE